MTTITTQEAQVIILEFAKFLDVLGVEINELDVVHTEVCSSCSVNEIIRLRHMG